MKYENEIIINLPRPRVLKLFDNPDNMQHWQDGFVSFEPMTGTPGAVGATARLNYLMGKRKVVLLETITSKNLPSEFSGTYETKGIWNKVENFFYETEDGYTRWLVKAEFKFGGFMKWIGFLMPGSFKKQSLKMMESFKKFAESYEA